MNDKKHATELHEEHKSWLSKLDFYADDMKVMKNRLAEIMSKNTDKDILAKGEHFQNQFIVQQENIDTLKHKVNEHENWIQRDMTANPVAADHRLYADSPQLRDEVSTFEKVFNDLRHEFDQFLSKHM